MRSSAFVSAFIAAERRFVALTRSAEVAAEVSEGGLVDFSSEGAVAGGAEGGPEGGVDPLWSPSGAPCVFVLMFACRAARFVVNAAAADSASCLACRNFLVLSCSSDHRR